MKNDNIKKALMNASTASMIYQFSMNNINILEEMGYKVDVACNFGKENSISEEEVRKFKRILENKNISSYETDCPRDIFAFRSIWRSYNQLKKLADIEKYDIVHTQSPIGGVICRLAFRKARKNGTRVIYTAHGFHFYKGAPMKNWLVYYPIEKFCSRYTDTLITINQEDYTLAKKKMKAKQVVYVPGVGINLEKFGVSNTSPTEMRNLLSIPEGVTWVLSVGELIKRKNHETLIRAVAKVDNLYLTIAGQGVMKEYLQNLINELGVSERVKLLGFRTDISELCAAADVFAFPSFQEGLPVALMEAMASGKAVICSKIRGNTDLIDDGKGGILFDPSDVEELERALEDIKNCDRDAMGAYNVKKVHGYDIEKVLAEEKNIYAEISSLGGQNN